VVDEGREPFDLIMDAAQHRLRRRQARHIQCILPVLFPLLYCQSRGNEGKTGQAMAKEKHNKKAVEECPMYVPAAGCPQASRASLMQVLIR
jgi:hypothetical protein